MHEPYTCIQCNFTCKWKSEYERHLNTPKHRELKKEKKTFHCKDCDYTTSDKKDYNKHLLTVKHKRLAIADDKSPKIPEIKYVCECGKVYKARNSLWYHKKKCTYILTNNTENEEENENSEIIYQKFAYNTLKKIQEHQKDIDNLLIMLTKKREECF